VVNSSKKLSYVVSINIEKELLEAKKYQKWGARFVLGNSQAMTWDSATIIRTEKDK
jgi:hypothetical protein